jgi:hypothetical protein
MLALSKLPPHRQAELRAEPFARTAARVGHVFGRHELDWHGNVLQLGRRKLVQIEPDAAWPGMWRVRTPDGRLTDMVNISRARDAARALALAHLNQRGEESPAEAPPIAPNDDQTNPYREATECPSPWVPPSCSTLSLPPLGRTPRLPSGRGAIGQESADAAEQQGAVTGETQ